MLQINRTDDSINPAPGPPEFRSTADSLAEAVAFIRRHFSIMLLTCFVTIGAGVLYLITAVPTFTARAELVLDSKGATADPASASTIVGSQIAIIKSESVARSVIRKLGLAEDPEFAGQTGALRSMIRSISRSLGWDRPETEASPEQYALESFDRKLSAKRDGLTYIVEITIASSDPERAAQILNAVAETYIMASMEEKYKSTLRGEKWVQDRTNELSSQASAAKKAVEDYHRNRSDVADSADTVDAGKPSSQWTAKKGDLRELEAAVESSAQAYENSLRILRRMDAMQQQSLPEFDAHLLTAASPPFRATWPKARIVLGISMVGGIVLGILIGVLRDLSGRGSAPAIRSSRLLKKYTRGWR
jgi:uncharacterized protein involved in exopolysaccharide biosynthesis